MARKKIVFIIVEGQTDSDALGMLFSRLYSSDNVYVEVTRGDITSRKDVDTSNIVSKIGNLVRSYANLNHFKKVHFKEVIHIMDTDGAYIPDECVIEDLTITDKPYYTVSEIRTSEVNGIIDRNKRKSRNMDKLSLLPFIWKDIPYRAYYMSSNLEHALYDKLNCSNEEKEKCAFSFAKKYKDDLEGFLKFISDSDFSKCNSYKESWDYIKKDLHSLERNTNLGICFKEEREDKLENQDISSQ